MADLSSYINFTAQLDKSVVTPCLNFTDTGNYPVGVPAGITGIINISYPDGTTRVGDFDDPDVTWNGSSLVARTIAINMSSGDFEHGMYVVTYIIKHASYDPTTLQRSYTLDYTAVELDITKNFDVFTPDLSYTDSTVYTQTGFTTTSINRSWSSTVNYVGSPSAVITGTGTTLDLAYGGEYYDAEYDTTLVSTVVYTSVSSTWFSIKDKITGTSVDDAYTPPTIQELLDGLTALRASLIAANTCQADYNTILANYLLAGTVYTHLVERGRINDIDGLDAYVLQLQTIFNNNITPVLVHTNEPIPAYDWGAGALIGSITVQNDQDIANVAGSIVTLTIGNTTVKFQQAEIV